MKNKNKNGLKMKGITMTYLEYITRLLQIENEALDKLNNNMIKFIASVKGTTEKLNKLNEEAEKKVRYRNGDYTPEDIINQKI